MEDIIKLFKNEFELINVDAKEFNQIKVGLMKFENEVYDIPLLGRLTLMKGKAMAYLMKMGALVLTCKGKNDFDSLISDYIKEFINIIKTSKNIYIKSRTDLNKKYVDDLLSNGGSSTNVFAKKIGKEKTKEFFYKYFFGIIR